MNILYSKKNEEEKLCSIFENMSIQNKINIPIENINKIIKIQSLYRGYCIRKYNKSIKDTFNSDLIVQLLSNYKNYSKSIDICNTILVNKKIRKPNFPSEISENMVKYAFYKKYKIFPTWDTDKGDLQLKIHNTCLLQLEVKGFMSNGPVSFGPSENWDYIYFVDARNFYNDFYNIYEIKLSNTSTIWKNIILSGTSFSIENIPPLPYNINMLSCNALRSICEKRGLTKGGNKKVLLERIKTQKVGSKYKKPETYGEIAKKNQRGKLRGSFDTIFKPQLTNYCTLLFSGHIHELFDNI